jgi:hypothetical protein
VLVLTGLVGATGATVVVVTGALEAGAAGFSGAAFADEEPLDGALPLTTSGGKAMFTDLEVTASPAGSAFGSVREAVKGREDT